MQPTQIPPQKRSLTFNLLKPFGKFFSIFTRKHKINQPLPNQTPPAMPGQSYGPTFIAQPQVQPPASPIPNYGGVPGINSNVPPIQPASPQTPVMPVTLPPNPNVQPGQPQNITNNFPPTQPPEQPQQ
jgi:hypothetical protein